MSFNKNFSLYLLSLWKRSEKKNNLSFLEKIFFLFLIFFEKIYLIIFKVVCFCKNKIGNKSIPFKVISVGNISIGGTGKSVFVQFLIKNLDTKCAILSRGYGVKNKKSKIVSNGTKIFYPASLVGDEPLMLAQNLGVPVVVGKNRFKSAKLLVGLKKQSQFKSIFTIILDDGYQNFSLKKDFEILLLDARKPFENGYCLPAGRLREKNMNRADVIIFTHADKIADLISLSSLAPRDIPVFFGKHKLCKFLHLNKKEIAFEKFKGRKILAFAGIGNFNYFLNSILDLGLNVFKKIEYADHYKFYEQDLEYIFDFFEKNKCDCIITTSKDWVKIYPLLKKIKNWKVLHIYVLEIEFEFLTSKEKEMFLKIIKKI